MKKIIIAIDGHSSCGKSTMAKDLARKIGYTYIDSGAMYRVITLYCIENNLFSGNELNLDVLRKEIGNIRITFRKNDATGHSDAFLNDRNVEAQIRSMAVAEKVSFTAAVDFVREALVGQQQAMGREKGIVMDGRDIGTVVFPGAELKIFVTASPEIRAQRRLDELIAKGEKANFDDVLRNIEKRDYIDSTRKDGPLRKADDALLLDNSTMTVDEQNQWLNQRFREKLKN
ncbi:MAG: (d)CMP kinase [Dysgonamonadaceae bacterium]|jgi:cytidylate kinase|nr:(d)CMP kinase [Dysgonamonadaceae bacterium]